MQKLQARVFEHLENLFLLDLHKLQQSLESTNALFKPQTVMRDILLGLTKSLQSASGCQTDIKSTWIYLKRRTAPLGPTIAKRDSMSRPKLRSAKSVGPPG